MRPRRIGTIGHTGFNVGMGLAAAAMLALMLKTKPGAPRQPTPEEIAAHDKRTERERWNDEVAARKAAKQIAKKGYVKP